MTKKYELAVASEDKQKDNPPFSSLWRGLNETTTAHGIPRVAQYKGPVKIGCWTLIILLCFAAVLFNTADVFIEFLKFDVNVDVKVIPNTEMVFPAVTICNLTPINRTALLQAEGLDNLKNILGVTAKKRRKRSAHPCPMENIHAASGYCYMPHPSATRKKYTVSKADCEDIFMEIAIIDTFEKQNFVQSQKLLSNVDGDNAWIGLTKAGSLWKWEDESPFNYSNFEGSTASTNVRVLNSNYTWEVVPNHNSYTSVPLCQVFTGITSPGINKNMHNDEDYNSEFVAQENAIQELSNLKTEDKQKIGYTASAMILDCQYGGRSCHVKDFETFYNPLHGNCYMFNAGWNSTKQVLWSKRPGVRFGLHLIIDIHQDQYLTTMGKAAGVRILIKDQNQMPFPEEDGLHASPGYLTAIGMKKVGIKKDIEYTPCVPQMERNRNKNVYEESYPVLYSTVACMKTCYQRNVISECDCADPYIEKYGEAFNYVIKPSCDLSNATQASCRTRIFSMYSNGELMCNKECPIPCMDTEFVPTLSTAQWPSEPSMSDLINEHAPRFAGQETKVSKNLLKIEIFYNDFSYELITERPAYTKGKLVGDLGGSLGLWIGWSAITFFEFVELTVDFFVLLFMKKCAKKPLATDDRQTGAGSGQPISKEAQKHQKKYENDAPPYYRRGKSGNSVATSIGKVAERSITPTENELSKYWSTSAIARWI